MAVDIKTLRIGAHISIGGKRVRVCGITQRKIGYHHPDERPDAHLRYARIHEVEPIAITPGLLEELGFEEDKTDIVKRVGGYFIYFHQINNLRLRVSLEEENCTVYGNTLCRYLHEAEAFLALHGVELIPD